MTLDVFVLGPTDSTLVECLEEGLRQHGFACASGAEVTQASRVLVCAGAPPSDILLQALRAGVAVLPVRAEPGGWLAPEVDLDALTERVVGAIDGLLAVGVPERLHDDAVVERAIDDIDALVADHDGTRLDQVCDAISLAIARGAPIYNAGSAEGCAAIYAHVAGDLVDLLEGEDEDGLLEAVRVELNTASIEAEEADDADQAAWTLRHAFDRLLVARHTAEAIETLDGLFDGLQSAGRSLNASLVYDVISLAISHGAPIYNAGSHVGCAQIYLRTADGLLRCLGPEPRSGESRTEKLSRGSLPSLVDTGSERLEDDATDLCWDLRHAFDALVEVAAEERGWEHDS